MGGNMHKIWKVIIKQPGKSNSIIEFKTQEAASLFYKEFLLNNNDENVEIVIEETEAENVVLTNDEKYLLLELQSHMEQLARLINKWATVVTNHEERLEKLEE